MKPIQNIPKHLKRFTLRQNYNLYTPIDHAGWRFIMHLSQDFFKSNAHEKYLDGLPATGISIDSIPRIEDMDRCLKKMGWRAAVVSGFIPPAIFLEFLSLGILPIACDMRSLAHLHYTPAPDIVHEAAGHAPILTDPEYSNYIRKYGEISQKVIFSAEDLDVYNAIRQLSDIKEDPKSTKEDIARATADLDAAVNNISFVSEATQLSRMAWWTIEYGLVGSMAKPLIYGAGLLSSVGESYDCFVKSVKKVPLTLDCINVSYDITKPQPQLFVTPNFSHLVDVLEEFSLTMAYRNGAQQGLKKALQAKTVTTTQWSNDIQMSGILEDLRFDSWSRPSLLKWKGPCQISFKNKELKNFGPDRLIDQVIALVGALKNQEPLKKVLSKKIVDIEFESEMKLKGTVAEVIRVNGKVRGAFFKKATLNGQDVKNLLVVAADKISTVFGEAADRSAFYENVRFPAEAKVIQKTNLTAENQRLNELYLAVRNLRKNDKQGAGQKIQKLHKVHEELQKNYPLDWLLRLEILEAVSDGKEPTFAKKVRTELDKIKTADPEQKDLIARGLELFG